MTITGVVKLINSDQSKKAREKSLFMVYVNANNVVNHKAKMHKVDPRSSVRLTLVAYVTA